ncbi:hypothetical protein Tco_0009007 [Tanacetum coccineum]
MNKQIENEVEEEKQKGLLRSVVIGRWAVEAKFSQRESMVTFCFNRALTSIASKSQCSLSTSFFVSALITCSEFLERVAMGAGSMSSFAYSGGDALRPSFSLSNLRSRSLAFVSLVFKTLLLFLCHLRAIGNMGERLVSLQNFWDDLSTQLTVAIDYEGLRYVRESNGLSIANTERIRYSVSNSALSCILE